MALALRGPIQQQSRSQSSLGSITLSKLPATTFPCVPKSAAEWETRFLLERPSGVHIEDFDAFFADLPVDPSHTVTFEGQRQRRLAEYQVCTTEHRARSITRLAHKAFYQSRELNPVAGGIVRKFARVNPAVDSLPSFISILDAFFHAVERLDSGSRVAELRRIGVHQIRIKTGPENIAIVTPEDFHQDGFDYVGIFCVNRTAVIDGMTQLRKRGELLPKMESLIAPGALLTFDDRFFEHNTTPILSSHHGYRDVFVLTASAWWRS
jgi:hypothetical protein